MNIKPHITFQYKVHSQHFNPQNPSPANISNIKPLSPANKTYFLFLSKTHGHKTHKTYPQPQLLGESHCWKKLMEAMPKKHHGSYGR